jgi:hypothetical protein
VGRGREGKAWMIPREGGREAGMKGGAVGCPQAITFPGRSLPYEVQNHVRPNFAIPMLYTKNHSKFYKVFCTTIKPLELYFVNF